MSISRLIGFSVPAAGALALLTFPMTPRVDRRALAEDILAQSRAAYASLKSYADTGVVDVVYGGSSQPTHDRHSFVTFFRSPRHYYFDFLKQGKTDRLVIWSDDAAFYGWWKQTGVETEYPKGQGSSAFTTSVSPTSGSIMQIAPLLFPKAGLAGTLTEFGDATEEGTEKINGHPCHKLVGVAQSVYPATGHVSNVRKTTVWIDVETLLVRRVFEDKPKGSPASWTSNTTTTFEPHPNPVLDDARFRFAAP